MNDFTQYKNIGPRCHAVFTAAGLTTQQFDQMSPGDVLFFLVENGQALWALSSTSILYQVIWGAQHHVTWHAVPQSIKDDGKFFAKQLKESFSV